MPEIAIFADSRRPGYCRSCGAAVEWAETVRGTRIPFDILVIARTQTNLLTPRTIAYVNMADARTHFQTCPDAKAWRRP